MLAVNAIYFPDNSGFFLVSVSYKKSGVSRTCWPGWGWGDDNHNHCGPPGQEKKTGQSSQPTHSAPNEQGKSGDEYGKSGDEHGKTGEKGNSKK